MGLTWVSCSVLPFAIGGAGRVRALISGDPVDAVAALCGPAGAPPASPDAAGFNRIDLALTDGVAWTGNFYGWPTAPMAVFVFAHTAAGWQAADPLPVELAWAYTGADFPWIRPWVVGRLQEVADRLHPLAASKRIKVSGVFPTDTAAFPVVTVQVDGITPAGDSVGRHLERNPDGTMVRGTLYNINLSIVAWAKEPEDRDDLAVWMGQAMEVLVDLLPGIGCLEPSVSLEESEDFQTLDVPTFLVTARLNTSRWSRLTAPPLSEFGHITV